MKKVDLKNNITEILGAEVSAETLEAVLGLIDQLGKREAAGGRAKEIEKDGNTYRWCTKHELYEPLDWFPVNSKGEINPACTPAVFRWRKYGKDINHALKNEDYEAIGKLTLLRKKGGYDLKEDIKEFKGGIEEELGFLPDPKEAITE